MNIAVNNGNKYIWIKNNGSSECYDYTSSGDILTLFEEWRKTMLIRYNMLWETVQMYPFCSFIMDDNESNYARYHKLLHIFHESTGMKNPTYKLDDDDSAGLTADVNITDDCKKEEESEDGDSTGDYSTDVNMMVMESIKILLKSNNRNLLKRNQLGNISIYGIKRYFECLFQLGTNNSPEIIFNRRKLNGEDDESNCEDDDDDDGLEDVKTLNLSPTTSSSLYSISPPPYCFFAFDSLCFSLGSLIFSSWRSNKEYITIEKYKSLLRIHLFFIDLLDDLKNKTLMQLRHQSYYLESLYTTKKNESIHHLLIRGDIIDCIRMSDLAKWCRDELESINCCINTIAEMEKVYLNEKYALQCHLDSIIQDDAILDKYKKHEIKSQIQQHKVLSKLTLQIVNIKNWCGKLSDRLTEKCECIVTEVVPSKLEVSSSSQKSSTSSNNNATSVTSSNHTRSDHVFLDYFKSLKTGFTRLNRMDVFEATCVWWKEGIKSTDKMSLPASSFNSRK